MKNPFAGRARKGGTDIGFEYRRKVGRFIALRRGDLELTQEDLGKMVGIRPSAISAIELGRNPIPPERYLAFAVALDLSPDKLGKFLLEYTDPWLFNLIYGEGAHDISGIPERLKPA
jgi:transcriptional regulator with XRE-family HTH domain